MFRMRCVCTTVCTVVSMFLGGPNEYIAMSADEQQTQIPEYRLRSVHLSSCDYTHGLNLCIAVVVAAASTILIFQKQKLIHACIADHTNHVCTRSNVGICPSYYLYIHYLPVLTRMLPATILYGNTTCYCAIACTVAFATTAPHPERSAPREHTKKKNTVLQ